MQQSFFTLLCAIFLYACSTTKKAITTMDANNTLIEDLLKAKPKQFASLLANKDSLRLQIIYTKIDRNKNNQPTFTDYSFNLNTNTYFYPASTVKMPIAFLALEKLNELKKYGIDKHTAMLTDSSFNKQTLVYTQPNAENSVPTIANYIKQIFLVSDNDAFNRLYEFLGQEYIQTQFKKKGYEDATIRHRLQITLTAEENKHTNPINFYDTSGQLLYAQAAQYSKAVYPAFDAKMGKGYYKGSKLVNEPFDFSTKNRMYLQYQHNILRSVLFPESVPAKQRFNLTKEDEDFVLHWMSAYPKESKYPNYDTANYWDAYCKFMLHGSAKGSLPEHVRIYNKVGDAYGFITDITYVIDVKNNVEFMLSATMLCNSDGIFNDDKYDYETIGFPFMKNLGQAIYEYELKRERKHKPNLSKFMIDYNTNQ